MTGLKKLLMWAAVPQGVVEKTITGNPVTFRTKLTEAMSMVIPFSPIQAGTGDPSPTNVRAISGFASANVFVTGKNLVGELRNASTQNISSVVNSDGSVTFTGKSNGTTRTPSISIDTMLPAGSYYFSGVTGGSSNTYGLRVYIDDVSSDAIYDGKGYFTLTKPSNVRMAGRFSSVQTSDYNVTMYPMICLVSETDDTFEKSKRTVYPITFPTSAGTVYGGELTVNADGTGELVVTHKVYDMADLPEGISTDKTDDSQANNVVKFAQYVNERVYGADQEATRFVSAEYNWKLSGTTAKLRANLKNGECGGQTSNTYVWFRDDRIADDTLYPTNADKVAAFKSFLTDGTIVYPVRDEYIQTYSLTVEQVKTIVGLNNVWTDTNGINTVTYKR